MPEDNNEQVEAGINGDAAEPSATENGTDTSAGTQELSTMHPSHFRNTEAHSVYLRYGIPLYLVCTLTLLINSDVGSGVTAEYVLIQNGEIYEQEHLLKASIFSSIKELWHNGSYPLAILIAVTSVMWPYVKLILTFYSWFMPYRDPRKREFLVEMIDALGKWSFVDIVVLVEIVVAFRSTILIGPTVVLEIVIEAQWGFYGFVVATMLSLCSTHVVLHHHRKVHYHSKPTQAISSTEETELGETQEAAKREKKVGIREKGGLSNTMVGLALLGVLLSLVFYLTGCFVDLYEVVSTRGSVSLSSKYNIVNIGTAFPDAQLEPDKAGTRFVQVMWFFLCVAMPLTCSILFGLLFAYPFSDIWLERIFVMGEITFAWSCAEVLFLSTIFSVVQMPTFGTGLIEADCLACFEVDTIILGTFALLCIGSVLNVGVNIWLYRKAHHIVFGVV